jgi:hypothetical protein
VGANWGERARDRGAVAARCGFRRLDHATCGLITLSPRQLWNPPRLGVRRGLRGVERGRIGAKERAIEGLWRLDVGSNGSIARDAARSSVLIAI